MNVLSELHEERGFTNSEMSIARYLIAHADDIPKTPISSVTDIASLVEELMGTDCVFLLPEGKIREARLATFFSQACTQYVLNCIFAEAYAVNYQSNFTNWHDETFPDYGL